MRHRVETFTVGIMSLCVQVSWYDFHGSCPPLSRRPQCEDGGGLRRGEETVQRGMIAWMNFPRVIL